VNNLSINQNGIEVVSGLASSEQINSIIAQVSNSDQSMPKHGVRNAEKKFSSINQLIKSENIINAAKSLLGKEPQLVRVIYFDKTPDKNWLVTWHQDKTVALDHKFSSEGWGPWTVKDKTHHVQPPLDILNTMVTFRVHLDKANKDNGCLKVIPDSHKLGILKQDEVSVTVQNNPSVLCEVEAGDTIVMRPHLLHSSSKSSISGHRRVVHIEFSSYDLPNNARWA
jgi:ectoine hydroxylase-related dioxygenase (phytanoyl-CoA dioxygenase family)